MEEITCNPIGFFQGDFQEKYALPRQAGLDLESRGQIVLLPHHNFEQALEDLEGFERIWVIYWFHKNVHWKPKVLPPRGGIKRGVFATRSPHRPNSIGLSCLKLVKIEGLTLTVESPDLIDGTPILDIKPYIEYADCFEGSKQGWLDLLPEETSYSIVYTPLAEKQLADLKSLWQIELLPLLAKRLSHSPKPYPGRRIRLIEKDIYELAIKAWRITYRLEEEKETVIVMQIGSGDIEEKEDRFGDREIHRAFKQLYQL